MNPDLLLSTSYNKFNDILKSHSLGDWYRASYQRRIRDDVGTRYFITIAHGVRPSTDDRPERPFFVPEVQFEWQGTAFNADFLLNGESVDQVEKFYADLWARMRCGYYEGGPAEERGYPQLPLSPAEQELAEALAVYKDRPYWGAADADRKAPAAFDIIRRAADEHLACLRAGNVISAARALSKALHAGMNAIDSAFAMQAVRGNWYEGSTFGEELKALDSALAEVWL